METQNKKLTVFLDNIGRTIIGKVATETPEVLSVENPALVHIQPNVQTQQLQLQILPLFFKEFQADKDAPTIWNYNKKNITTAEDIKFAFQFAAQYEQLFQAAGPTSGPETKDPEVIKLFDEEEKK
jgi:hypothetical protein